MEIRVPLFKLFVYSVVDVVDEFEEVTAQKMLFYLVMAWSFSWEAIFVLKFYHQYHRSCKCLSPLLATLLLLVAAMF